MAENLKDADFILYSLPSCIMSIELPSHHSHQIGSVMRTEYVHDRDEIILHFTRIIPYI